MYDWLIGCSVDMHRPYVYLVRVQAYACMRTCIMCMCASKCICMYVCMYIYGCYEAL